MDSTQFDALPPVQKQEYIQMLKEELTPIFTRLLLDHPLFALVQAWCSVPIHIDTHFRHPDPPDEETMAIIVDRYRMATMLTSLLTQLYILKPLLYRTENFRITFQNTDGSTGNIVIDNFQSNDASHVDQTSFKIHY